MMGKHRNYRVVLFTKTVIAEDDAATFYRTVSEAIEGLEDLGQGFGWLQTLTEDRSEFMPQFDELPEDYKA